MKTLKTALLTLILLLFSLNSVWAQQAFQIHQDNVKPSMVSEYEKIAKEFHEASVAHNVQATWYTAMSNDYKYFYVSPIENMAELDQRPFADMAKVMGDKFGDMFDRFDKCYNSHGTYIIIKDDELSYMPDGETEAPEDETYRTWYYMYYSPENADKIREGMKAVKEMFKTKGSKSYYRVYREGMGQMESYYLVSVSSKDEIEAAQKAKANQEVLGPDRWETFDKVMKYVYRMEEERGKMRPDLYYAPTKKEEE